MSRGWGFSTIFLPQGSGLCTFFVPGGGGDSACQKIPRGFPGGWSGLELTDTYIKFFLKRNYHKSAHRN